MAEFVIPSPPDPICDFCSSPEVVGGYHVKDFVMTDTIPLGQSEGTVNLGSLGGWAVCKTCQELVDAQQWDTLEKRSVESFFTKYGNTVPRNILEQEIHILHKTFRENLIGKE